MVPYAVKKFSFEPDAFVHELVDSIIGDNYPVPDRMLVHAEKVVHEYLMWAMCDSRPPKGKFDLFAVEGGTAAMCYTFKSLMKNHILHKGDTIALGVPIFTPYIEIAELDDYDFNVVHIRATQENEFQYSDAELKKLENPKVKAFFIVNPGNPSSGAIAPAVIQKLVKLVRTKRPDLLILTDDVYGTFVNNFRSLMADLPRNTIGVYSYSKYFGCTGWRLGVIAIHEDNVIDEMIKRHPKAITEQLNKRYGSLLARSDQAEIHRPHRGRQPRCLPQPHGRPVAAPAGADDPVLAVPAPGQGRQLPEGDDGNLPEARGRHGRRGSASTPAPAPARSSPAITASSISNSGSGNISATTPRNSSRRTTTRSTSSTASRTTTPSFS